MAYEPTNWKAGDVVTSAKLNKMEQGIANTGSVMIVETTFGKGSDAYDVYFETDKTAEEIKTAFCNGSTVLIHFNESEETRPYSVYGELYLQMIGWQSATNSSPLGMFDFQLQNNQYNLSGSFPTVADNGKLHFNVYVD